MGAIIQKLVAFATLCVGLLPLPPLPFSYWYTSTWSLQHLFLINTFSTPSSINRSRKKSTAKTKFNVKNYLMVERVLLGIEINDDILFYHIYVTPLPVLNLLRPLRRKRPFFCNMQTHTVTLSSFFRFILSHTEIYNILI